LHVDIPIINNGALKVLPLSSMTEDRLAGNYSYVVSANYSGRTNFNRHVEIKNS